MKGREIKRFHGHLIEFPEEKNEVVREAIFEEK